MSRVLAFDLATFAGVAWRDDFKEHVRAHYVETGDLTEVKQGFQLAMNDLRDDVRLATATMGDIRDTVIVIASKIS